MPIKLTEYDLSVFINCPFDSSFKPIFDAIVFTVFDCGFIPRSAREAEGEPQRLERIIQIIAESRLSIHDLSRAGIDRKSGLARFNMPFELGVVFGAREFGSAKQRKKSFTLFDKDQYRYMKFISDLNGYDPAPHGSRIEGAIRNVRNFLQNQTYVDFLIPGPAKIIEHYDQFKKRLPKMAKSAGSTKKQLIYFDYCFLIQEWLAEVAP